MLSILNQVSSPTYFRSRSAIPIEIRWNVVEVYFYGLYRKVLNLTSAIIRFAEIVPLYLLQYGHNHFKSTLLSRITLQHLNTTNYPERFYKPARTLACTGDCNSHVSVITSTQGTIGNSKSTDFSDEGPFSCQPCIATHRL